MSARSDQTESQSVNAQEQMVAGSAWMTAGSIFSRILGAVYIIPWSIWFGSFFLQGNALYGKGYNIYSFFLIAAIAGVPSAIAKQVAHYNALNEYGISVRLYQRGLVIAVGTGVAIAALMYFGAGLFTGGDDNLIPVLHSLAWAILIIPTMSLTRGYFQGFQQMAPSAISQFVEQLARVAYMLITAFLIMKVLKGDWVTAVAQSTLAAAVGALCGLLILGVYYWRRRGHFQALVRHSNNALVVPANQLYREIVAQAVPFIVLGAGITIFQLIDQYTFAPIMHLAGNYSDTYLNDLFALFGVNANKIIMITISLASALAITVVPLLSEAYTWGNKREISGQLTNAFLMFEFVMIPSALGMSAVARPLNIVFYGHAQEALGASILAFSSYLSIILGLYTVVSALMQGISQNRRAVKYFLVGTVVKFVVQWPLVYVFGAFGPLMATGVGFLVTCYLIIHSLNVQFGIYYVTIAKQSNGILLSAIVTFVIARLVVWGGAALLGDGRMTSFVITAVAAVLGGGFYVYTMLHSRLADTIMGPRMAGLRRRLHIR
ncbi:putative polysaccharide biosynthesis protein [Levilactobacillus namurensis]|uniref:putative polysaccharide biosynthesis protein n=1 Tax=Levilactobacillus namurensis TaxID=380393 RepID=UPI00223263DA|nr:polysaccharide biosynthesis protein [Levilactobacillus namurensis]MCW3777671.1 polysaccharide biosynthesis protein [Levilactobacillus namurensis]MDT7018871.1 polysaccharide biosynthesis protein [Levilactobacillus namurensis]WNN66515.1 polysaccharide biosynthesis protein [Levilactobacillus namurensis]